MAVFGRFTRQIDIGTGIDHSRRNQSWYKQTAPYDSPLAYEMTFSGPLPGNRNGDPVSSNGYASWNPAANSRVILGARERFFNSIGPQAELGVGLLEMGQSLDMISRRGLQLFQIFRALKRRDLRSLRKVVPSARKIHKSFANAVLETNYGWVPLVMDIGNAIDVLQGPVKPKKQFSSFSTREVLRNGTTPENGGFRTLDVHETIGCHLRAYVEVSNANLYLANQLGFVNPAAVAWESIPFSFVYDWFQPVGAFLNQWTDGFGLTLKDATTTRKSTLVYHNSYVRAKPYTVIETHNVKFSFSRQLGIASFSLPPFRFTGFSARRGLNAISLCLQQLR